MKRTSIFLWITLIFLLAFIGIGGAYFLSLQYIKASTQNRLQKRFEFIAKSLIWQLGTVQNPNSLIKDLQNLDFLPITHPKEMIHIAKHAKIIKRTRYPIGEIIILKFNGEYYIWIQSYGNTLLLKDLSQKSDFFRMLYTTIFAITTFLLLLIYVMIIFKLKPLKKITKELEKFSQGKLDLDLENVKGFKEVSEVAHGLQEAAKSLKAIQNSRKLLLRNIMHELKTPITKGRIQAEMVEDLKQKERLIHIFEKLNSLINELAALEAVNSKIKPQLQTIKASDLITEAINIGMFDKKELIIEYKEDPTIQVDYRLMAIALKNLIDNALKYSTDRKVKLEVYPDRIEIHNKGNPLPKTLAHYLEPFTKDGKRSGFGLGLYIVDNILKMHNFKLAYQHQDGITKFIIENLSS
ncbi:MAG: HAMP domain-containing histidine kinase [Epsilonproteobacteria bacterium]|nr:HAMP domain-containing histidine kinase [Campylobacterota bacterium]